VTSEEIAALAEQIRGPHAPGWAFNGCRGCGWVPEQTDDFGAFYLAQYIAHVLGALATTDNGGTTQ
jgi:hypothetical protein